MSTQFVLNTHTKAGVARLLSLLPPAPYTFSWGTEALQVSSIAHLNIISIDPSPQHHPRRSSRTPSASTLHLSGLLHFILIISTSPPHIHIIHPSLEHPHHSGLSTPSWPTEHSSPVHFRDPSITSDQSSRHLRQSPTT